MRSLAAVAVTLGHRTLASADCCRLSLWREVCKLYPRFLRESTQTYAFSRRTSVLWRSDATAHRVSCSQQLVRFRNLCPHECCVPRVSNEEVCHLAVTIIRISLKPGPVSVPQIFGVTPSRRASHGDTHVHSQRFASSCFF